MKKFLLNFKNSISALILATMGYLNIGCIIIIASLIVSPSPSETAIKLLPNICARYSIAQITKFCFLILFLIFQIFIAIQIYRQEKKQSLIKKDSNNFKNIYIFTGLFIYILTIFYLFMMLIESILEI